jgi:DNA polymerase IV
VVPPGKGEAFVEALPVGRFHGVGPVTAAKMERLGIRTGADLRAQTLDFLVRNFRKSGPWYYGIARGVDERAVNPNRERKSSGSETTFNDDLVDPDKIEAGVLAMADDVWAWCERTDARGRTVTVKIKWADFQQSTRSRSLTAPVDSRDVLHAASLELIRSAYPLGKGIRLVGVTLSNFVGGTGSASEGELPLEVAAA